MKIYEPNYTQIPNAIISMMPQFTESEFKVVMAICRKTLGWQKTRDRISLSQLQKMTGLGRASVCNAIKSENFKGIVKTYALDKGNEYELLIHELGSTKSEPSNKEVVQNLNQCSMNSEPIGSMNSEHTKETLKETIQKKGDKSPIPSLFEVKEYFKQNGYKEEVAEKAYNIYNASIEDHPKRKYWRDSRDNLIKNWKLKMQSVWFKEENKIQGNGFDPEKARKFMDSYAN